MVVLAPFMIQDLGWSRGEIMLGVTAIMLFFGITSPLTAWMITRIGARKTIVIGGCIAAAAAFLMSRLGHVYPLFVTLSVFLGLPGFTPAGPWPWGSCWGVALWEASWRPSSSTGSCCGPEETGGSASS